MITIEPLVDAALRRDHLQLRSLTQDLLRSDAPLQTIPRPRTNDAQALAVAAGLVELLAQRTGQAAALWTNDVGPAPEPFFLLEAAARMQRLRAMCEAESPTPLKQRRLYAPPDFLDVT